MKRDIENSNDITLLVETFYKKVSQDELMAPHFANTNWEHHLPRMIGFWEFVLLDKAGYTGNVFDAHVHLKIDQRHFDQWINYFKKTIDELFSGEKAEFAKQRAELIAYTFSSKLAEINKKRGH